MNWIEKVITILTIKTIKMKTLDQIKSLFKKYKECKKLEGDLLTKGVDRMIIDLEKVNQKELQKLISSLHRMIFCLLY